MYSARQIEQAAKELRVRIWEMRDEIWLGQAPHDSRKVLDPEVAAIALGIQYEYHDDLGNFGGPGDRHAVAGCFHRHERRILVSRRFGFETRRFTGAHEIGHAVLHKERPEMTMHRDRPVKGLAANSRGKTQLEWEADRFAAAFLVPPKFLRNQFVERFGTDFFTFDENAAFWLRPDDHESLVHAEQGSLDRARALATATYFAGNHINSLADIFQVSADTMALRLGELGLIREWP